ncbi:MAG: hypothetical protein MJZ30_06125 [Paludibacteraceae bacterium]|nr:hypothetical protein [Paludibacteraceae bacterium]
MKKDDPYCWEEHPIRESIKDAVYVFLLSILFVFSVVGLAILLSGCSASRHVSDTDDTHTQMHYEAAEVTSWERKDNVTAYLRKNDSLMHQYKIHVVWYDTNLPKDSATGMHPIAATADIGGEISVTSEEESSSETHAESAGCEVKEEVAEEDDETHSESNSDMGIGGFSDTVLGLGYLATVILLFLVFLNCIFNKKNKID